MCPVLDAQKKAPIRHPSSVLSIPPPRVPLPCPFVRSLLCPKKVPIPPSPLVHSSVLLCDSMYTVCPFICPIPCPSFGLIWWWQDARCSTDSVRPGHAGPHRHPHTCPSSVVRPRAVIRLIRQASNPRAPLPHEWASVPPPVRHPSSILTLTPALSSVRSDQRPSVPPFRHHPPPPMRSTCPSVIQRPLALFSIPRYQGGARLAFNRWSSSDGQDRHVRHLHDAHAQVPARRHPVPTGHL